MTVRSQFAAALSAVVLLLGTGCGGGESTVFTAETDDRNYQEGQRLVRQGRDAEALSAFLKVIEKRGEQASAESHLEAGLICLNHIKDPIEAMHHFKKYLELQPNSKQAAGVRSLIDTAKREFARTIPAHPLESQVIGADQSDEVRQLRLENDELRAALSAQQTATTTQFLRASRASVEGGDIPVSAPATNIIPLITSAPIQAREASITPTIVTAPPPPAVQKPLFTSANSAAKDARAATSASSRPRKHTIVAGDTLYRISVKYFGNGSKVDDIFNANRDVMPNKNTVPRPGLELKIP